MQLVCAFNKYLTPTTSSCSYRYSKVFICLNHTPGTVGPKTITTNWEPFRNAFATLSIIFRQQQMLCLPTILPESALSGLVGVCVTWLPTCCHVDRYHAYKCWYMHTYIYM